MNVPVAEIAAETNAVVASWVVFVAGAAVGATGTPVRAGEASGARLVSLGWTWSPREKAVATPAAAAPSIAGSALEPVAEMAVETNAVVASWVVFVAGAAVGASGTPVRAGEASGAR